MIPIDINCDLGEGDSQQDCDNDALIMPFISRCNIACGGHAGNKKTIIESLQNANKHQLKIGAHPGYPDKENFGRCSLPLTKQQLEQTLKDQIDSFLEIANQQNIKIEHIKFHGALYNDIEKDPAMALQLGQFVLNNYPSKILIGLSAGELEKVSKMLGITFLAEGFMDRRYLPNGTLTTRSEKDSMIEDQSSIIKQAIILAKGQLINTKDNQTIKPKVDTICIHGDNPQAISLIKALSDAFAKSGITIR